MSRIPLTPFPTVAATPLPDGTQKTNHTPGAYGSGVGAAVEGFGNAAMKATQEIGRGEDKPAMSGGDPLPDMIALLKAEEDETAVKEIDVAFNNGLHTLLHDPEKGFFTRRGRDAMRAYGALDKQIRVMKEEYARGVANSRQATMFRHVSESRHSAIMERATAHVRRQRSEWLDKTGMARMQGALDDAAADPAAMGYSAAIIEREVRDIAERGGWEPDRPARVIHGVKSLMARTHINQVVENDPLEAARLLHRSRERNILIPAHDEEMDKLVRTAAAASIGKAYAQALFDGKEPADLLSEYRTYGVEL